MFAVAHDNRWERYGRAMSPRPTDTPSTEIEAYSKAIKRLRQTANLTQLEAAKRIGQTKQSWQAYEAGNRQVVLRLDVQDRVARALGVSREDLVEEREKIGPPAEKTSGGLSAERRRDPPPMTIPVWGRARAGLRGAHIYDLIEPERFLDLGSIYSPTTRAMQLIGDSVYPWAASGTMIIYDVDRWPRRDQGCVIETIEDGYYVKLFDRADDENVYVRELQPEPRDLVFKRSALVGVYAVIDRIDH